MTRRRETAERKYFLGSLKLFSESRWLYEDPVTKLLLRGHLDNFPEGWLEALKDLDCRELNEFVVKKTTKEFWPKSLNDFVEACSDVDKLNYKKSSLELNIELSKQCFRGLSPKKWHEICHLTQLVHEQCSLQGIDVIVDLGAGLGYICQLLHELYGYRVLGLEASPRNTESAKGRQEKYHPLSRNAVKFVCCKVNENSIEIIESLLREHFEECQNVGLIGLHACGDLSVDALKAFSKMAAARLLVLMSCCYHKMAPAETGEFFCHFPLSVELREALEEFGKSGGMFLERPFLRLACQESAERWNDASEELHRKHGFHVLARAVLELYAHKEGFRLEKRVQKGTRKSQCADFETYLLDSLKRYRFKQFTGDIEQVAEGAAFKERVKVDGKSLWDKNSEKIEAAEAYTALQMHLQSPAESLILMDRICWLNEQGKYYSQLQRYQRHYENKKRKKKNKKEREIRDYVDDNESGDDDNGDRHEDK
ncbi:methyltransferase-like protein 25 [Orussus abietinus]|uniref:methyltransferase-like protein 25 n=1 Tax=Orussus abietinus TaxID=222816 RepID=UPI0006252400|nr:methyltransferase-like protein 25 [Orussus abietinus]